jgi:hypothetical protein
MQSRSIVPAAALPVLLGVVLASSCGAKVTGAGTGVPPDAGADSAFPVWFDASDAPATPAIDRMVRANCTGYRGCCASNGFAFNQTMCEMIARLSVTMYDKCPHGTYDPVADAECAEAMEPLYAVCQTRRPDGGPFIAACHRVCTGALPLGARCDTDSECAPSTAGSVACLPPSTTSEAVCMIARRGMLGDPCGWTCADSSAFPSCTLGGPPEPPSESLPDGGGVDLGTRCFSNDGLYCPEVLSPTCQPVAAAFGEPCPERRCPPEQMCLPTGKCVPKVSVGGRCNGDPMCVDGAYCAPGAAGPVCIAKQVAGTACPGVEQCLGYCDPTTKVCKGSSAADVPTLELDAHTCGGSFVFD